MQQSHKAAAYGIKKPPEPEGPRRFIDKAGANPASVRKTPKSAGIPGLKTAFALGFLAREFARTPDRFSLLTGFFNGGFLEMLLELHFAEHAFALELFLQGPKGLFDVVIAYADLHVVVTTFLS